MKTTTRARDADWSFALACNVLAAPSIQSAGPLIQAGNGFHLLLIRSGAGILATECGRLVCRGPALICLNDGESLALESAESLDADIISFDPSIINDRFTSRAVLRDPPPDQLTMVQDRFYLLPFIDRCELYRSCLELPPAILPFMEDRLKRLAAQLSGQHDGYWPCRSRSYLLEILFSANQLFLEKTESLPAAFHCLPGDSSAMEGVLLWLNAHFSEEVGLEELARRFGTNRTTLNERFQACFGMSVKAYLIDLRMRFAALLLRDTALPVGEIMERAGFFDPTHFSRMYKKKYQVTPLEYRGLHCWLDRPVAS
jgi:AraC family L-rhamnose operon regulatory protein RhaS